MNREQLGEDIAFLRTATEVRVGLLNLDEYQDFARRWFGPTCVRIEIRNSSDIDYNDEYYSNDTLSIDGWDTQGRLLQPSVHLPSNNKDRWALKVGESDLGSLVDLGDPYDDVSQTFIWEGSALVPGYAYWGNGTDPYEKYYSEISLPAVEGI